MIGWQEAYDTYAGDIKVTALSQRIAGLDYDDVVSEMLVCLWKATQTYRAGRGGFAPYWWSIWMNRKADLQRSWARREADAIKPVEPQEMGDLTPSRPDHGPVDYPTQDMGELDRMVWDLLSAGETATEVMDDLGLSRRKYYATVGGWRNDDVRQHLRHA